MTFAPHSPDVCDDGNVDGAAASPAMAPLNARVIREQRDSPHRALFARLAEGWCSTIGSRLAELGSVAVADLPGRLHEIRSLSHAVGARAVVVAAADIEQRVERGSAATANDIQALTAAVDSCRYALNRFWSG